MIGCIGRIHPISYLHAFCHFRVLLRPSASHGVRERSHSFRLYTSVHLDHDSESFWFETGALLLSSMRAHAVPGTAQLFSLDCLAGESELLRRCSPNGPRVGLFSVRVFEVWCKCSILCLTFSHAVGASERS